jgi:hypothetical protein
MPRFPLLPTLAALILTACTAPNPAPAPVPIRDWAIAIHGGAWVKMFGLEENGTIERHLAKEAHD